MAEDSPSRASVAAKTLGLAIFIVGVVLLGLTFLWSYRLFHSPELMAAANSASGRAVSLQHSLAAAGVRVAMLFIMAYVASLLSSRGVQLYAAGRGAARS
jgi:steroid 5-alpha reductase family enzyme